jgi:hypothetical protein
MPGRAAPTYAPGAAYPKRKRRDFLGYSRVVRSRDQEIAVECGQRTRDFERMTLHTRQRLTQESPVDQQPRRSRAPHTGIVHILRKPGAAVARSTRRALAADELIVQ